MSGESRATAAVRVLLSRVRPHGRRQVPFVAQLTPTDCGAACLSAALAYYGREQPLSRVRAQLGGGRNGVSARQLVSAARAFGFRARGVRVDVAALSFLTPGSILHWELTHFVVFQRCDRKHVHIMDPALGCRRIPLADAGKALSGVAILLEPSDTFGAAVSAPKTRAARYRAWLFGARGIWLRLLSTSLFLQLLALAVPGLMGVLVDKVVPRADQPLLALIAAGCLSMASFHFLSSFLRARLLLHLRTRMEARMSLDFVEHLLALPYSFFQQRTTGDLTMRLSSQAAIRELLTTGTLSALLDGALVLFYFVLLLGAAPSLAAVAAALAGLQIAIVLLAARRNTELMSECLASQARLEAYQVEMLAGVETLKAMGAAQRATARWSDLYVDVLNGSLARGELEGRFQALIGSLRFSGPLALLLTGAHQVLAGSLSLGTMLALSALGAGFLEPVANLVNTGLKLTQLRSYMARLEDVLDERIEPQRASGVSQPLRGAIEVRGVSFRYPSEQRATLEELSFAIEPGECVAIVGASGSGKSTLARLLAGLYAPAAGTIAYDGVDLRARDLAQLRGQLGIVTQDTRLFSGTLLDNVTMFDPSVPREAVQAACELACLHGEIARMPMGYETMLADGGSSLSGGQRQRLSLARALLRQPDVLILDEAASALDTVTERELQANLRPLACTRVVVAHRLSTIADADKILVLEHGRLVGLGRHRELMLHCPAYQALVHSQGEPSVTPLAAASSREAGGSAREFPALAEALRARLAAKPARRPPPGWPGHNA